MGKLQLLVLSALVLLLPVQQASSTTSYWGFYCAGGNYTLGSPYSSSLAALAAVLPGRVSSSPLLFNSTQLAAAAAGGEGATVYAVAQCQMNTSRSACERCVRGGLQDARRVCPFRVGAFVFRDVCTLGYYKERLNLFPDRSELHQTLTLPEPSDVTVHGREIREAVGELAWTVANRTVARYFATGEKMVRTRDYQLTLYALAQCSPSLTAAGSGCKMCLVQLLGTLFLFDDQQTGGRAATLWCFYRYSSHRMFSGQPSVMLPAHAPGDDTHTKKLLCILEWVLGAVGTALVVAIVIIFIATVLYFRRKRLSRKNLLVSAGQKGKELVLKGMKEEDEEARHDDSSGQLELCPSALDGFTQITQQANMKEISIFLDYDGTLSPIVKDPARAYLSDEMRAVLQNVAILFKTSIVSGRGREKVFDFVNIKQINYAGSHGMDIKVASTTDSTGSSEIAADCDSYEPAKEHRAMINEVFNNLRFATRDIEGANIEHNVYCVSLHYRNVAQEDIPRVEEVVDRVLEDLKDAIKLTYGHKVFEFRPPTEWNKGHAVLYLLGELGLQDSFAIYIGDDVTDEDAFKVLRARNNGIGILVSETSKKTSACFLLKNPHEVMEFLKLLVNWKQEIGNGGQELE